VTGHALLILLDGVGAGRRDPEINPLTHPGVRFLANFEDEGPGKEIPRDGRFIPIDACLGVDGLPQSATGQTALLTGVDAPSEIGRHLPGFPNARLREVLREHSILRRLADRGRRVAFVNAFRPRFFELGDAVFSRPLSASTNANFGLRFADLGDLSAGRALYHDITNRDLVARGFPVPVRTPQEAGLILAGLVGERDFTFFEFFRTDLAGHSREFEFALDEIGRFELFLEALLAGIDASDTLVLVVADHGNIEDLSFKGHTRNPAQALAFGAAGDEAAGRLRRLTDVAPFIEDFCERPHLADR
jgi:2,3-bisphosphoglycerate-independent phosphoglycerate mutase